MFWTQPITPAIAVAVLILGGPAHGARTHLSITLPEVGFEQIIDTGGVKAFKHRTSSIIRLGAEGRIQASPSEVRRALLDYHRQVGIIDRLSESRVLARGDHRLRVYQRLNLPVISDRDFTLEVRWGESGGVQWIEYRAVPAGPAPRSGVVRVPSHEGSWQLKPMDGGSATFVRFEVSIDLGGWLPKWMARSGAGKELPALFGSICQLVQGQPLKKGVACVR